MTQSLRCLLVCILLFVAAAITAIAQPADSRGYRGNDGKTYGERDMERTADRTAAGNTPYTQWSFDQKAINDMVEQWKRNSPNYRSPDEIAAGEAGAKQLRAAQARREAIIRDIQTELAINNNAFMRAADKAGFIAGSWERISVTQQNIFGETSRKDIQAAQIAVVAKMMEAKQSFDAQKSTAPAPQLLQYIFTYAPFFETALEDLNWMEDKHPGNRGQIDTARLLTLAYFFGKPYGVPDYPFHYEGHETSPFVFYSEQLYLNKYWVPLSDKYPALALVVAGSATPDKNYQERNPYYLILSQRRKAEDAKPEELARLAKLALLSRYPASSRSLRNDNRALTLFAHSNDFYNELSYSDWDAIAAAQHQTIPGIMSAVLLSYRVRGLLPSAGEIAFMGKKRGKRGSEEFDMERVLQHYAEAGDPSALNALGVMAISGLGKGSTKEGIAWLHAAARNGSVYAHFNLVFAASLGLRGYGEAERAEAESAFIAFIKTASWEQTIAAINQSNNIDASNSWDKDFRFWVSDGMRAAMNARSAALSSK